MQGAYVTLLRRTVSIDNDVSFAFPPKIKKCDNRSRRTEKNDNSHCRQTNPKCNCRAKPHKTLGGEIVFLPDSPSILCKTNRDIHFPPKEEMLPYICY